jgi:hypothetical protein
MATPRKRPEDKVKTGRPTDYSPELAAKICHIISTHPNGLGKLQKMYDFMPDKSTIFLWIQKYPEFSNQYFTARKYQAHVIADSILDIPTEINTFDDKDGVERIDSGILGRAKFDMECRKWHASKLEPKIYGDFKQDDSQDKAKAIHEESMERAKVLEKEF